MAGASMKDIKLRIKSMESTKQITKAMEMVASSKLRHAQDRVLQSRPYFEILYKAFTDIMINNKDFTSPFLKRRDEVKHTCYIVIAGDRGLAGGYNHNVINLACEHMQGKDAVVLPIGKKALEYFKNHNHSILTEAYASAMELSVGDCFTLAKKLSSEFLDEQFDEVYLVYTNFVSILSQSPAVMQMLPLEDLRPKDAAPPRDLILYEPDCGSVYNAIVPEYLGGLVYGALCESVASEQAARRTAMDSATKNAEEMIDSLSLQYNRARQGAITQEITEIVAGAEA